jgi:hypothetical protein
MAYVWYVYPSKPLVKESKPVSKPAASKPRESEPYSNYPDWTGQGSGLEDE